MATIKPGKAPNPGLASLQRTPFDKVVERAGKSRRRGNEVDGTYIDFYANGEVFASLFGEEQYGLGSVLLEKENYKSLSSFVTQTTNLAFPTKGTIESRPIRQDWAHGTTNGTRWQIHEVILGDVTFDQFKPQ